MEKKLSAIILMALIIICGGCSKKAGYKPKPIRPLKEHAKIDYQETQKLVTLRVKMFNDNDCNEVFEDRANRLNDIIPLQISVENNSNKTWHLCTQNIASKCETIKYINHRLGSSYNPFMWALTTFGAGLLITAAFGLPLVFLVGIPVCGSCHVNTAAFLFFGIPTVIGMLAIYATPIAFGAALFAGAYANEDLNQYLHATVLCTPVAIAPNTTIDKLLFVRAMNYKERFDVTLTNDDADEKLMFLVTLPTSPKAKECPQQKTARKRH